MGFTEFIFDSFTWALAIALCGGGYVFLLWLLSMLFKGVKND